MHLSACNDMYIINISMSDQKTISTREPTHAERRELAESNTKRARELMDRAEAKVRENEANGNISDWGFSIAVESLLKATELYLRARDHPDRNLGLSSE